MERLTKRCKQALNDKMTKFKKFIEIALSEPKYHEKGNFSTQSTYDIYETNKLYPMASKLADYEDAEEQGLLLKLPCKVGDTVYLVDFEENGYDVATVGSIEIDAGNRILLNSDYEIGTDAYASYVFYSKEEAEKALADMGV